MNCSFNLISLYSCLSFFVLQMMVMRRLEKGVEHHKEWLVIFIFISECN